MERILPREIEDEMKASYIDYAMSVLVGRALPDVRDGLKPVHRRILYSMLELGLQHSKPFRKCARIVGDCLGKYHPHGDTAVYDSLVRMAQNFSLMYPLVDGQGNFGSVDGDNAAAMRYCVSGDSLIVTEKGLLRIDELSEKEDIDIEVLSKDKKTNRASKLFDSGNHPTFKITTHKGYSLTGTANHPVLTLRANKTGKPVFSWKLIERLKAGDFIVIDRSSDSLWPKETVDLSYFYPAIKKTTKIRILPKYLDKDLGFILGCFVAEGTLSRPEKVEFCSSDEAWIDSILQVWSRLFPDSRLHKFKKKSSAYGKLDYFRLECHCRYTLEFLRKIGLEKSKSEGRFVPKPILQSPKEVLVEFLKAYFEGDGGITQSRKMIELSCCSKSEQLITELQVIFLRFGIDSFKRFDKYRLMWKLYIRGFRNILRFYKEVGFVSDLKNKKLEYVIHSYKKDSSLFDFVPFLSDYIRSKTSSGFIGRHNFDRYSGMSRNYGKVAQLLMEKTATDYTPLFEYFLTYNYLFDPVVAIQEAGIQRVFSVKVESDCHSFISNGFISHNTEARMSKIAEEILEDIDADTVNFVPNFDGSLKEPVVLPCKFPNLLVNGSSGIAVGMATNIPPHNLGEVTDAVIMQIDTPEITNFELMSAIKGPDFPTGGIICGTSGIKHAYETGKGILKIKAKTEIEEDKGRTRIIVNEIPFQVNKAVLVEEIADLIKDKDIAGISDLRDESDRDGMRIVIELKKDANSKVVLNQLFSHTRLESTFGINLIALVDNQPKILPLRQIIFNFISHRKEVVVRRTRFEFQKASEKAHILEGIIIALNNIDAVINRIKSARDTEMAKASLISGFSLTEKQSLAILDMKLQRLSSLEQQKVKDDHSKLLQRIKELKQILESENLVLEIIKKELVELKEKFGQPRKTEIVEMEEDYTDEDLVKAEDVVITMSHSGYIKRMPLDAYREQKRGGKGMIAASTREGDFIDHVFIANTHSYILFFTDTGRVHWLKVFQIPEGSRQSMGKAIVNLLEIQGNVNAFVPVREFKEGLNLVMATRKGIVKKTSLMAYSNPRKGGIIAITLDENDKLINVALTDGNNQIILATKEGMAVKFNESDIRSTGRSARGVFGIRLREDEVIGMVIANETKSLLTVTENGYGKRSPIEDYRLINRGGYGVINIQTNERNGKVVAVKSVSESDVLVFISRRGIMIKVPASGISVIGRNTQGARIMRLEEDDKVVASSVIANGSQDSEQDA